MKVISIGVYTCRYESISIPVVLRICLCVMHSFEDLREGINSIGSKCDLLNILSRLIVIKSTRVKMCKQIFGLLVFVMIAGENFCESFRKKLPKNLKKIF